MGIKSKYLRSDFKMWGILTPKLIHKIEIKKPPFEASINKNITITSS